MYTLIFLLYSLTFASDTDGRSILDPIGNQLTTHADEGPGMCPHGGRNGTRTYAGDDGVGIDPNGRVRTAAVAGDKGLGVDPNG